MTMWTDAYNISCEHCRAKLKSRKTEEDGRTADNAFAKQSLMPRHAKHSHNPVTGRLRNSSRHALAMYGACRPQS